MMHLQQLLLQCTSVSFMLNVTNCCISNTPSENEVNNDVMAAAPPQPDVDPWGEAGRIAQSVEKRSRSPLRRRCVVAKVTSLSNLWHYNIPS